MNSVKSYQSVSERILWKLFFETGTSFSVNLFLQYHLAQWWSMIMLELARYDFSSIERSHMQIGHNQIMISKKCGKNGWKIDYIKHKWMTDEWTSQQVSTKIQQGTSVNSTAPELPAPKHHGLLEPGWWQQYAGPSKPGKPWKDHKVIPCHSMSFLTPIRDDPK